MAAPFTLSDLTLNEYATLARLIGCDPAQAMTAPASVKYAEAHAGLLVMRHRRDGNTAFQLTDAMSLTLLDVTARLGLTAGPDDTPASDDDDDARSVDEVAADAAADATGAAVDPTVPPASHGSAITQGTPPLASATAHVQR